MEIWGALNVGWYVVFKEGSETLTQTAEDKDEALLVACDLYLRGQQILCVGPFGRDAHSQHEIRGVALRTLLHKLVQK
jgi:hypothetical protein